MPDAPAAVIAAYSPSNPTAPTAIQAGGLPAGPSAPGNAAGAGSVAAPDAPAAVVADANALPVVAGTLSSDITGTYILVAPQEHDSNAIPGEPQWSSDGSMSAPASGVWGKLLAWLMVTPQSATLAEIAPIAEYTAAAAQSEASTIEYYVWGTGWKSYWLYSGALFPEPRWTDTADAGMDDMGETVIPAGARILYGDEFLDSMLVRKPFPGGLGAEWEAAAGRENEYFLTAYNDGSYVGYWRGTGRDPYSIASWTAATVTGTPVITSSVGGQPDAPGNAAGSGSIAAPTAPSAVQP
jgi:hypothetical protein